jgi:hypothetical protein
MKNHVLINILDDQKKNKKEIPRAICTKSIKTITRSSTNKTKKKEARALLLFIKTSVMWLMLPRLIIMEAIAIGITMAILNGNDSARYVANTISNTFGLVAGLVVGYMVTLSFDAGLDKFHSTMMIFKKDVLLSLISAASAVEACALARAKYRWKTEHNVPSKQDVNRMISLVNEMGEILEVLPYAFKRAALDVPCEGIYEDGITTCDSLVDPDTLPFRSDSTREKIFVTQEGDPLYYIKAFLVCTTYLMQEIAFADTYTMISNIQCNITDAFRGVQKIQTMYGVSMTRIYNRFIGLIIYSYVLCIPIMAYSEHYWPLTLVLYPLIVYVFLAPHVIGNMLRSNPHIHSPITLQPIDFWCNDTSQEVSIRIRNAISYIKSVV